MSFSIAFSNEPLIYPFDNVATPAAPGILIIGDMQEGFYSSLYQWSKNQYENQWRQAIEVLVYEDSKAALIVEYLDPDAASQLVWWPMYKEGETVYIQNHLLVYNRLTKPFCSDSPFASLCDRRTIDEDGQLISEWSVSLAEIEQFARKVRV